MLSKSELFLTTKRFPVEGYKPLQDPPISGVAKAMELISCLDRLLPAVSLTPGGRKSRRYNFFGCFLQVLKQTDFWHAAFF